MNSRPWIASGIGRPADRKASKPARKTIRTRPNRRVRTETVRNSQNAQSTSATAPTIGAREPVARIPATMSSAVRRTLKPSLVQARGTTQARNAPTKFGFPRVAKIRMRAEPEGGDCQPNKRKGSRPKYWAIAITAITPAAATSDAARASGFGLSHVSSRNEAGGSNAIRRSLSEAVTPHSADRETSASQARASRCKADSKRTSDRPRDTSRTAPPTTQRASNATFGVENGRARRGHAARGTAAVTTTAANSTSFPDSLIAGA